MNQKLKFLLSVITAIGLLHWNAAAYGEEMDSPDEVELDALAQYYEPVQFDHALHVGVADCAACHHHTTGTPVLDEKCAKCHANSGPTDMVACRDCHSAKRFEAEYLKAVEADNTIHHDDKIGLKAAYHIRCMNCHEEMGAPNGCQDCHSRNDIGDKLFHSGKYAPVGKKSTGGSH